MAGGVDDKDLGYSAGLTYTKVVWKGWMATAVLLVLLVGLACLPLVLGHIPYFGD